MKSEPHQKTKAAGVVHKKTVRKNSERFYIYLDGKSEWWARIN